MSVTKNLQTIQDQITQTANESGRDPKHVELLAVSKKQPDARIQAALDAGHRLFAENRVQEAQEHWTARRESGNYPDLKLHLIGPLQTNKAKEAVALFDVIETLDREKLARSLAKAMQSHNQYRPCLIQVNTGEEPQKAGIAPADLKDFHAFCRDECQIKIQGLMCIPPLEDPAALHFALLQKWAGLLNLPYLSMGMSGDFEKAIPLGATHIRIGTGIFGQRPNPL